MASSPLMFDQNALDQIEQNQQNQVQPAAFSGESDPSAIPSSPVISPMQRAAMAFMKANTGSQPAPIRTANIGGHNILQTNSPGDNVANMNNSISQGLNGIASQYLDQKNLDNRQKFIQSVHQ